jgi:hypothetical protein
MKLTKEQIAYIDNYLKFLNIKSADIRIEILDHLASEIESEDHCEIGKYIKSKNSFIREFSKKRENSIHWSYQKQLWLKYFGFFHKLKIAPITLFSIGTFYVSLNYFNNKTILGLSIILVAIVIFYGLIVNLINTKKIKALVSFKYLGNVLSIPQLFICTLPIVKDYIIVNPILITIYVSLALGLSVAAVILIKEKKNLILKRFEFLNN